LGPPDPQGALGGTVLSAQAEALLKLRPAAPFRLT
jgi:hypothetical protein